MYSLVVRSKGGQDGPARAGDENVGTSAEASAPADAGVASAVEADQVAFSAGNPRVEHVTGVVHLYRHIPADAAEAPGAALDAGDPAELPEGRNEQVCVLALPPHMGFPEFCTFLGAYFSRAREVRLVRRDGAASACLVLLRFEAQEAADGFYTEFNGKPFCLLEPELVCRLVFVRGVDFSNGPVGCGAAGAVAAAPALHPPPLHPPPGATELPSCPVCLDRLDEHVSGVVTTVCNHRFHNECLRRWGDTSCPVCRYCQAPAEGAPRCAACGAAADLWICLICGHAGCGRYRGSHAHAHWQESGHGYALELETQRVWDYSNDAYVHRLVRSKTDGKVVEVSAPGRGRGGGGEERSADGGGGAECSAHGHAAGGKAWVDPDIEEALVLSKLDSLATEYNHLLVTQLESQRQHFEGLMVRQRIELDAAAAAAEGRAAACNASAAAAAASAAEAGRLRRQAEDRLAETQRRLAKAQEERQFLKQLNDTLLSNQKQFAAKLAAAEARAAERDAAVAELQEQVRDLMVFIEGRQVVERSGGGELGGGTVLPVPEGVGGRRGNGKGKGRPKQAAAGPGQ